MVSNQKIDELLKSLDDTVDSLESGLNCNDETRKIVRDWLASAQQGVQPTLLESGHPYMNNCHCSSCKEKESKLPQSG